MRKIRIINETDLNLTEVVMRELEEILDVQFTTDKNELGDVVEHVAEENTYVYQISADDYLTVHLKEIK